MSLVLNRKNIIYVMPLAIIPIVFGVYFFGFSKVNFNSFKGFFYAEKIAELKEVEVYSKYVGFNLENYKKLKSIKGSKAKEIFHCLQKSKHRSNYSLVGGIVDKGNIKIVFDNSSYALSWDRWKNDKISLGAGLFYFEKEGVSYSHVEGVIVSECLVDYLDLLN